MAAINILGAVSTSSNLTIPSPFGGLSGSTIESSMGSEGSTKHSPSALSYLLFTSSVIVVGNVWCIVLSVFSHLSSYSALTVHLATGNIVVKVLSRLHTATLSFGAKCSGRLVCRQGDEMFCCESISNQSELVCIFVHMVMFEPKFW